MTRIVLFENIHPSAVEVFAAAGLTDVVTHASSLAPDALREALKTADLVGIRSRTHLDAALFDAFPQIRAVGCFCIGTNQFDSSVLEQADQLKVLGCFCIGTNQVDLGEAERRGVPVFNAPFSNTRSVAELVLGEAILLLRRVPEKNARVHEGFWDKTADGAFEARGKTLGIIGYGNIGSQVGTLAEAAGMRVIFHDIEAKLPLGNARAVTSLKKLLAQADVVSLHVPGGRATQNIINASALASMKRGAILINASRGTVVDIQALHDALVSGHLSGAALDSPLRGLHNVILTPHIGGSTQESQENIGREVAEKLVSFALGGTTKGSVNFPEIPYQTAEGTARILHVHRNEPGALGTLSSLMAQHGLNIISQHLQTRGQIGYAVSDVDGEVGDDVLQTLRAHPITVRCDIV